MLTRWVDRRTLAVERKFRGGIGPGVVLGGACWSSSRQSRDDHICDRLHGKEIEAKGRLSKVAIDAAPSILYAEQSCMLSCHHADGEGSPYDAREKIQPQRHRAERNLGEHGMHRDPGNQWGAESSKREALPPEEMPNSRNICSMAAFTVWLNILGRP